jgi:hypothetical protein
MIRLRASRLPPSFACGVASWRDKGAEEEGMNGAAGSYADRQTGWVFLGGRLWLADPDFYVGDHNECALES